LNVWGGAVGGAGADGGVVGDSGCYESDIGKPGCPGFGSLLVDFGLASLNTLCLIPSSESLRDSYGVINSVHETCGFFGYLCGLA